MTLGDQQAFPRAGFYDAANEACDHGDDGMTYREWVAALALQGLLSSGAHTLNCVPPKGFAEVAVNMADALIQALNTPKDDK